MFRMLAVVLVALVLGLTACEPSPPRYPLGMSEEEWRALPPEKRAEARMREAELRRLREERLRLEAERRAAEARARERREQERIRRLYLVGRPEDFVSCVLEEGEARFGEDWGPFIPLEFTLVRSERRILTLTRTNERDRRRVWVEFFEEGHRLRFCGVEPGIAKGKDCANLRTSPARFREGVRATLNAKRLFRNARVYCKRPDYRPTPPIIILEN